MTKVEIGDHVYQVIRTKFELSPCKKCSFELPEFAHTLKESISMKFVSHFKRICMYGEEGRLLIFVNRIYVFHSYQRFRWLLEITDS